MEKKLFGILDTGAEVYEYTLKNEDAELSLISYGAAIARFKVFGTDIVGGYDTLDGYIKDDSHQGAIIGRVANRVGGAKFVMDGREYRLPNNDGNNCLHGGVGFDRRIWQAEQNGNSVTFRYTSADGEEGFPARLEVEVTYTLKGTAIAIDYRAIPDGKTPIALTNHTYFNLDGLGGDILNHTAEIFADRYTEVGDDLIPTGRQPFVEGTVFDFRTPHKIGERIGGDFIGYDHNYVINSGEGVSLAATVTGRLLKMNVYTDQPGIQFYIGNFLGGAPDFKGGIRRIRHGAFCLETQTEPNCINHGAAFYEKGEIYTHRTIYEIERIV